MFFEILIEDPMNQLDIVYQHPHFLVLPQDDQPNAVHMPLEETSSPPQ